MKFLLIAALIFITGNTSAQKAVLYQLPDPAGFAQKKFSKKELKEDMVFWQKVMEESHVDLYHAVSRNQLITLREKILTELPPAVSHAQASFAVSRLIGALNEGHLGLAFSRVSDSIYRNDAIRFPYFLQGYENNGFIVKHDISNSHAPLPALSKIIRVNGIDAAKLYQRYASMNGGLEAWRRLNVSNDIRRLLFMDNVQSPFKIDAVVKTDTLHFTVGGFTRSQGDSISKALSQLFKPEKAFSFSMLPGNIAFIEFNEMDGAYKDSFAVFLNNTFAAIRQYQAKGLIIDLRKNGGGDSGLGDMLLSYITCKPYRNVSAVKLKVSRHSKALAALRKSDDPMQKKADKVYTFKIDELTQPEQRANRFNGKTAFLIGTGTFSSANMLANTIKDYQLATLIGEPTAEPGNDFGEVFSFMLPNTHIIATGATKMFVRANGNAKDFTGIQPDIFSRNKTGDFLQNKDRVLEDAVQWILR